MKNLKKLLGLIGVLAISVPATLSVVACEKKETPNQDEKIDKEFLEKKLKNSIDFIENVINKQLTELDKTLKDFDSQIFDIENKIKEIEDNGLKEDFDSAKNVKNNHQETFANYKNKSNNLMNKANDLVSDLKETESNDKEKLAKINLELIKLNNDNLLQMNLDYKLELDLKLLSKNLNYIQKRVDEASGNK